MRNRASPSSPLPADKPGWPSAPNWRIALELNSGRSRRRFEYHGNVAVRRFRHRRNQASTACVWRLSSTLHRNAVIAASPARAWLAVIPLNSSGVLCGLAKAADALH
jgi:hypothetical protein